MSVRPLRDGDIILTRRFAEKLLVIGRNGSYPDQILCEVIRGGQPDRNTAKIITQKDVLALENGCGMQMLLREDR
ncbi:hypothetical protein LJC48_01075 [Desulfovibrio sp. OttesenSCG-928-C06]|nr:hypothetical protein [Desulfovibrio sp. OttesenSCG-928-C06]